MSDATTDKRPGRRVRTRDLAEENRVCIRTIERWHKTGILPEPDYVNGRKYWPEGTAPKTDDNS
jgi:hypothetical protein